MSAEQLMHPIWQIVRTESQLDSLSSWEFTHFLRPQSRVVAEHAPSLDRMSTEKFQEWAARIELRDDLPEVLRLLAVPAGATNDLPRIRYRRRVVRQ